MDVAALVSVTGHSGRTGSGVSDAWVPVRGDPLLVHAVRALFDSACVDHAFVTVAESDVDTAVEVLAGFPVTVLEGAGRPETSVRLALHTALHADSGPSVVLMHDAMRAFAPPSMIRSVVEAVRAGAPAVLPVLPVADTVKQVDRGGVVLGTQDRTELRAVQTPHGFAVHALREACESDGPLLDRLDVPIVTVPGHPYATRIATPFDLTAAEAVFAAEAHTTGRERG